MIRLRKMTRDDLPLFRKWLYAPHVAPWFRDPLDWIAEVEGQDGAFAWIHHFIAEHEGAPIWFCQYYAVADSGESFAGYADPRGIYSIDYLVGSAAHLRRGFARHMVSALIEKIKLHDGARCVILQPEPENAASCGLLASCGFVLDAGTGVYAFMIE